MFFLILGASMSFIWFISVLRGRIAGADGGAGTLTALAFGSGLVTTELWVAAAGLWAVVADTLQETIVSSSIRTRTAWSAASVT